VVDWRDADALPGWDALARNAVEPNPFLEDWYLLPALRAMGAGHVQLLCLEVEGALAGLMPLAASRRYYGRPLPHLAAWTHPNAFFGAPLVVRGMEPAFWQALLAYADARAGMGLFLHLAQMPLAGGLADALRDVLTQQRRPHGVVWREEGRHWPQSLARGLSGNVHVGQEAQGTASPACAPLRTGRPDGGTVAR
jgi:hypothetical protein